MYGLGLESSGGSVQLGLGVRRPGLGLQLFALGSHRPSFDMKVRFTGFWTMITNIFHEF